MAFCEGLRRRGIENIRKRKIGTIYNLGRQIEQKNIDTVKLLLKALKN